MRSQGLREELEKAWLRGQELGARLEHLQSELEQAGLERQAFLREQEIQQQRYQGLEQRLEAELQAAATSKEEALRELKMRALQLEQELVQLRQGSVGRGPEGHDELRIPGAQSGRLIEMERSNATLVAEKVALQGQLQHLEGQLGNLQGRAQELLLQSQRAQEHSSRLQAEKSILERQGQELHRKLGVLEEEVRAARQSHEETRGQQQALLRDHEALAQLQRRQEAELEGLLARHRDLKANMRALELAHRELQGRHEQLQAQRANVEAQEVALLAERERLMQDGHRQRGLEEELRRLQSEHDRAQMLLAEVSRERGELQGERGELRSRLARLELERAQLEVQSQRLRESNQQLDRPGVGWDGSIETLSEHEADVNREDYVNGGEMFTHLYQRQHFKEAEVRVYGGEIVLALEHLHKLGIIYRDLKLENVLLDSEGHIVLTDFGLSKEFLTEEKERTFSFCGTIEYMAPEIIRSKSGHGKAVDWWSLGILLFELLTGASPFTLEGERNTQAEVSRRILKCSPPFPPRIGPVAQDLLQRLLCKDPKKRLGAGPQGAQEVKTHPFFQAGIKRTKEEKGKMARAN
ncbi:coiled-coil domain-containing protein 88B-like [Puma concolor]|uniref:non-specific serine/threonine protein kinase n=1 Tax=Puma concolor TaxID=9696 RepID=A0A6P6H6V3_PUMCO|nr:coiled-coil domain-containing protein 88B-like [Puma concolor]